MTKKSSRASLKYLSVFILIIVMIAVSFGNQTTIEASNGIDHYIETENNEFVPKIDKVKPNGQTDICSVEYLFGRIVGRCEPMKMMSLVKYDNELRSFAEIDN